MLIYKEKKEKDFRIVIFPMGENKIGLRHIKNFAIVLYLQDNEYEKLGKLILLAEELSDKEIFENIDGSNFSKRYFNLSSYRKILTNYNLISISVNDESYMISLMKKERGGFVAYKDDTRHVFNGKPTPNELGTKVMEMFEYKEKYDEQ